MATTGGRYYGFVALLTACALVLSATPINSAVGSSGVGPAGVTSSPHLPASSPSSFGTDRKIRDKELLDIYRELPLHFESNQGQASDRFDFLSRGFGYSLSLSATEAVFVFSQEHRGRMSQGRRFNNPLQKITMKLACANSFSPAAGEKRLPGRVNYLIGTDTTKHHTSIPTYEQIRYQDVYPGIDVLYYGKHRQLEYDFIVAPGANPELIAMEFEGADELKIDYRGGIGVATGSHSLYLEKPFIYQEVNGARREVIGKFAVKSHHRIGFELGEYDRQRPLVIDPVLSYSSFLGGSGGESGIDIKVDAAGNIYLTGGTTSANFPRTNGPSYKGVFDVFITKLNPSGNSLIFSTLIGGTDNDSAQSMALDSSNNIYVSGISSSTDYPTTAGAFQTTAPSNQEAIVTKLNASGDTILYSTYFGGPGLNNGARLALDASGDIYLVGSTRSTAFPTTSGAFQSLLSPSSTPGATDAFVAKIHPAGAGPADLIYSTYLGGNQFDGDGKNDIALDPAGFVYVSGTTQSTNFPTTPSAFQPGLGGNDDIYLVKMDLKANGAAGLIYSTYIGGAARDNGGNLALDASNNVYLTGRTNSTNFPVSKTALQNVAAGKLDAYVMKLNISLPGSSGLVYSTYLGGSEDENGFGSDIAVDKVGNAYITGDTRSTNLPVTVGAFQPSIGGVSDVFSAPGGDAFAAKLNSAGTALVYFTYLGGPDGDGGNAISIDSKGNAYLTGYTFSPGFPLTSTAFQSTQGGQFDGFVARINNPTSFGQSAAVFSSDATSQLAPDSLPNPIDDAQKFVRQQYLDFLNREPDAGGLSFWTNQITSCGADAQCIEVRRIHVSASFFLSIEFQDTGYLVDRLYLASFARAPRLSEFSPDTRVIREGVIVTSPGWEQKLEGNKTDFIDSWVIRPDFQARYSGKSNPQYIDELCSNAGIQLAAAERTAIIQSLDNQTGTRATVLRKIAENETLVRQEFNRAFVLMQYFGYLQRNPSDPPDTDDAGYNFWLGKLNQFSGDFINAEMVKAFLTAGEYRTRFGQE
jgi:hypothetical protein